MGEGHSPPHYFSYVFGSSGPIFQSPYSILSPCHAGPPALKLTSVICRCEGNGTFSIQDKETSLPFCFFFSVRADGQVKRSRCFLLLVREKNQSFTSDLGNNSPPARTRPRSLLSEMWNLKFLYVQCCFQRASLSVEHLQMRREKSDWMDEV